MRDNPPPHPPTSNPPLIGLEPLDGVERPAHLERPDALQVLALEPQPDDGARLLRLGPFLTTISTIVCVPPRRLRVPGPVTRGRRRQQRQRRVGHDGRAVDVRPNEVVRRDHRGARQGRAGLWVCHCVWFLVVVGCSDTPMSVCACCCGAPLLCECAVVIGLRFVALGQGRCEMTVM